MLSMASLRGEGGPPPVTLSRGSHPDEILCGRIDEEEWRNDVLRGWEWGRNDTFSEDDD